MKNSTTAPAEFTYNGVLKISDQKRAAKTAVQVKYNKSKATVSLVLNGDLITFTAAQTKTGIKITEKVMEEYILSGVSNMDDAAAAPMKVGPKRQSISFNIVIDYFSGENVEIGFIGNTGAFVSPKSSKKKGVFRTMLAMF